MVCSEIERLDLYSMWSGRQKYERDYVGSCHPSKLRQRRAVPRDASTKRLLTSIICAPPAHRWARFGAAKQKAAIQYFDGRRGWASAIRVPVQHIDVPVVAKQLTDERASLANKAGSCRHLVGSIRARLQPAGGGMRRSRQSLHARGLLPDTPLHFLGSA